MSSFARGSSIPRMPTALFGILLGLTVAGATVAQQGHYDFEALPLNRVLNLKDNWLSAPSLGELVIRQDDTAINGSRVPTPLTGLASGWTAYLSRVNDGNFAFSPFFGIETQAVLQFDTNAEAATGFTLGRDVNGNGLLDLAIHESGPVFGTLRSQTRGNEQFMVQTADRQVSHLADLNGAGRCCNEDSDWYRLQLRIDLNANGGTGVGSLYYKNLSRGDTRFQPVAELQNLGLRLGTMNPRARAQYWNAMLLSMRFEGSRNMPVGDNLLPRVAAVMGSDRSLSLQAVDGLAVLGSKFDLHLQPVTPAGVADCCYWQLSRVRLAAPTVPSGARLSSGFDLLLQQLDIQAVRPDLGVLDQVCLRYQGAVGNDPLTMRWKFEPAGCP